MKLQSRLLFIAVISAFSCIACSSSSGSSSRSDATTGTSAGGTDLSDGLGDFNDQTTDGADGATDNVDGADGSSATDASASTDGANSADGDDATPEVEAVCTDGEFVCKNETTLMVCENGQWRLKHNCPSPSVCDAEGGTCSLPSCNPNGTGKNVGDIVKDVTFDLVGGGTYNLHDACTANEGTMIVKVDTWCYWCGEYAPLWQLMADDYVKNGSRFLLLVGRDGQQAPATMQIAEAYKLTHGYNDNWMVAPDPTHFKIDSVVSSPAQGVPNMAVIGPDMRIAYVDPLDGATLNGPFQALSQATAYYPPASCEGYCQAGLSPAWCYCTPDCVEYDNCCPDACTACGVDCN